MAYGQPVWSPVDEPAHYDVIAQYAAGVYPHDALTTIRPETLDVTQRTGVFGSVVDNAYANPDARLQPMFPVALAGRTTYTGWLFIGPNTRIGGQADRSLFLRDLAANGYSRIRNLEIPTPLC